MIFVFGSLLDPEAEGFLLFYGKSINGVEWRHVIVFILGEDAGDEFRFPGLAGNDGVEPGGSFEGVEPEVGFALFFIEAMTEETIVRENGANVAIVADFFCSLNQGAQGENDDEEGAWHGKCAV